ncbi:uncharacterized protein FTJAE_7809 [Fusarium tjaetaba]|uniref:Uncharacterized protein n=1 Tax=Fusarium tjaetaba TaxID=1567544 RepID=A0A8H5VRA5_9HYPO|nr:uncharacterized protein FTJAE_7809 [Fusarium tjaetaba]KAF5631608.1 hypothetical protein FTJAE_7809 [Fusarium tjaetaba]
MSIVASPADGGYVSDGDKLLQASGQAVQISLMLACRSIASETRHLPFTLNTITFSTIYRPDWRKQALELNQIAHYHIYLLRGMVLRLGRLLTPDMYEEPSPEYSQYMPIVVEEVAEFLRIWDRRTELSTEVRNARGFVDAKAFRDGAGSRVGAASIRLQGNDNTVALKRTRTYLLRQLADKHPIEFSQAIEEILPGWNDSHSIDDFFSLGFDSWAMPTRAEVKEMVDLMQNTRYWQNGDAWYHLGFDMPGYNGPKYRYKRKYWFSAAAQAIRFLGQLSQQQRLLISKLILNEDRPAAAFPESHMIGMIPFCLENPKLHVEHHMNLWRNILARAEDYRIRTLMYYIEGPPLVLEDTPEQHQTYPEAIGGAFTGFIMHLLETLKEGLPSDSYSLIIGGHPDPNHATEIFSVSMKPYIAWLTVHTDCIAHALIAPANHHEYPFPSRASAQGIVPVSERSAIIQCDFTVDQPWDYEAIYNDSEAFRITALNDLTNLGMDFDADMLDVTTDLLDWEKVQREYYEIEELSEGVLAEPYKHRYLA